TKQPQRYWSDHLAAALLLLRHTASRATGLAPITMLTARCPAVPPTLLPSLPTIPDEPSAEEEAQYYEAVSSQLERLHRLGGQHMSATIVFATGSITPSSPVIAQEVAQDETIDEAYLHAAARNEDVEAVRKALDAGVDVNAKTEYGSTALFFACDRGNAEIVQLLLESGADPNVTDTFYQATPMTWAQSKGHNEIVALLLKAGVDGADGMLIGAVTSDNVDQARSIIESGAVSESILAVAKSQAGSDEMRAIFADLDLDGIETYQPTVEEMELRSGTFSGPNGMSITISHDDEDLQLGFGSSSGSMLTPLSENMYLMGGSSVEFALSEDGNSVAGVTLTMRGNAMNFAPASDEDDAAEESEEEGAEEMAEEAPETETPVAPSNPATSDADVSSVNWPAFRGTGSRGIADGQSPPVEWNVEEDQNVRWKTAIPGLGNSCPVVWEDSIFITTAFSEEANDEMRIGNYGNVDSVEDDSVYEFILYCIDKQSGDIIWQQTANRAQPMVKRHSKSSHANPTCATDGEHVIAFFGSEGLYCFSTEGELKWEKNLGYLDSGWFYDAGYQWGFGSSPIIFENSVIVQCDIQQESFIAAFDLQSGSELWRTPREEIPSWSSPVVHQFDDVPMLITHATRAARGYDARDGSLLWSMADHSEIVVPTPFVAHDLIYIVSGYSPVQPIVAIRPEARGEIQLADRQNDDGVPLQGDDSEIAWGQLRGGSYMPTPIVYGDYMYVCANRGILTCLDAVTGEEIYKERMRADGGALAFTGSPIAADGHIYMTDEAGRTLVVKAGPDFELVSVNEAGDYVMTTPAISEGLFLVRTKTELIAFGEESGDE
ncbi:MAG: PQQ-binding-like beta-propeller repeat protein, partial [Planctomycetota bacterium]